MPERATNSDSPLAPDVNAAREAYLHSCEDYLKRQILIYTNWPQRRFHALGYTDEKVFADMNA